MKEKAFYPLAGILIAVFVCMFLMSPPAYAGKIKLSYANFMPKSMPFVQMERWKKEVEGRTGGKVVINTYPGGTLLGGKDMVDGVIQGQADIGMTTMAYQPGRFMLMNAISLPLGIPNGRVGSLVLWDFFNKYKPKSFAKLKVLTVYAPSPSDVMSQVPIRKLEDFKGVEMRASGMAAKALGAWGATPVGMPMPAFPEALQKGVVKGMFSGLDLMQDFNFAEMLPYVTLVKEISWPFAVFMNLDTWNTLPKDVQKVMDDLSREHAEWTGRYHDGRVKGAAEWAKKTYNVKVFELSKKEKARWAKVLDPLTEDWIRDSEAKGLPAKAIVGDLRALVKKYSQ